jgi:hypothetical protein
VAEPATTAGGLKREEKKCEVGSIIILFLLLLGVGLLAGVAAVIWFLVKGSAK